MISHRSDLIAVVIDDVQSSMRAHAKEFAIRLHAGGSQMLLVPVDSGHLLDSVLPDLAGYRVDAIVSALAVLSPKTAAALAKLRISVIACNTKVSNAWVTVASTNNARAGAEVADHFLARVTRSFSFVASTLKSPASAERLRRIRRRLARPGFKNVRIEQRSIHYDDGFLAALAMFTGKDAPESRPGTTIADERKPVDQLTASAPARSGGCFTRAGEHGLLRILGWRAPYSTLIGGQRLDESIPPDNGVA
jgi:DNA-binding LacI/PurR family transcriptional regulator